MARLRSTISISCARGDDAIADGIEHVERVVYLLVEDLRPDDARGTRFDEIPR
jgi:hypothetical protein